MGIVKRSLNPAVDTVFHSLILRGRTSSLTSRSPFLLMNIAAGSAPLLVRGLTCVLRKLPTDGWRPE